MRFVTYYIAQGQRGQAGGLFLQWRDLHPAYSYRKV
jgi:hypothetical protein